MVMFEVRKKMYKPFLGDREMLVHWHVIPVQVWRIKATRHMVLSTDRDGNLTTASLHREQHVLSNHAFNMRHEELTANDLQYSVLYGILNSLDVPHDKAQRMVRKVARLARSMAMPKVRPIRIMIVDHITYMSREVMEHVLEGIDNEALAATIRASMEEESVKMVPAAKSSIENLEKVKSKLDDERCSICLEEFVGEGEEVSRMPCSHVYHSLCIAKWLEYNHLCPLCRFEMPKST